MIDKDLRLRPEASAVIVVDVQNDFCSPEGSFGRAGQDVSAAVEMVPRLENLLVEARHAGSRVTFVQTTHDATVDSPAWLRRHGVSPVQRGVVACRTGTWGAEFYRVTPESSEAVVVKHRFSAFFDTNLDTLLRAAGVTSLLFTGVNTEVCVDSSLRDGLFRGYDVTLVEDCCASCYPAGHTATVDTVRRNFGAVTTSGDIIEYWRSLEAR